MINRKLPIRFISLNFHQALVSDSLKNANAILTVVGALEGNYIFKPPVKDYPDMPQNEHLSMHLAKAFGITVVPLSLIRLKSGELSYYNKAD